MITIRFNKGLQLTCTPDLLVAGGANAVGGPVAGAAAVGALRVSQGKTLLGQDIIPRFKPPRVTPPRDLAGEEKRRRLKAIRSSIGSVPSGRRATIRSRGGQAAGAPAPILKTKLGQ